MAQVCTFVVKWARFLVLRIAWGDGAAIAASASNSIHSEHIALDDAHRLEVDPSLTSTDLHRPAVSRLDLVQTILRHALIASLCAPAFVLAPAVLAQDSNPNVSSPPRSNRR